MIQKKDTAHIGQYPFSFLFCEWMEVDSNHRSNLQQIYSLSPLATRESIHGQGNVSHALTVIYYSIAHMVTQAIFYVLKRSRNASAS